MNAIAIAPDFAAIKQRQQATWASGDYHMIGTQILIVSELLIEALDVHSTERVLDVATGSGNAALAAARRGCTVVGVDYVHVAARAGPPASRSPRASGSTFVEGDAEWLPVADANFDVVSSVFGSMFAPDQEQTASELLRVVPARWPDRPGGAHARGLHRSALQGHRGPRPAARRIALADPVGHGGAAARPLRRRDRPDQPRQAPLRLPRPFARGVRRRTGGATTVRP